MKPGADAPYTSGHLKKPHATQEDEEGFEGDFGYLQGV